MTYVLSRRLRKEDGDKDGDLEHLAMGLNPGDFAVLVLKGDQPFLFFETLFEGMRKLNLSDMFSDFWDAVEAFNPKLQFDAFGET